MGAWGTGPFDSDGALDFLGNVTDTVATVDDDFTIVPDTVDHAKAGEMLAAALAAVTRPATGEEYRHATCEDAYAAAGLVAAVRGRYTEHRRTRLFPAAAGDDDDGDRLGLGHHCGHAAVLRPEDAEALVPTARTAAVALRGEGEWLGSWFDTSEILEQLDRLEAALA